MKDKNNLWIRQAWKAYLRKEQLSQDLKDKKEISSEGKAAPSMKYSIANMRQSPFSLQIFWAEGSFFLYIFIEIDN